MAFLLFVGIGYPFFAFLEDPDRIGPRIQKAWGFDPRSLQADLGAGVVFLGLLLVVLVVAGLWAWREVARIRAAEAGAPPPSQDPTEETSGWIWAAVGAGVLVIWVYWAEPFAPAPRPAPRARVARPTGPQAGAERSDAGATAEGRRDWELEAIRSLGMMEGDAATKLLERLRQVRSAAIRDAAEQAWATREAEGFLGW